MTLDESRPMKVRLDKWLWAARFFRTRARAKQAIDGGKVTVAGVRAKAARELQVGDVLTIRQGFDEKEVIVRDLSEHRGKSAQAVALYDETDASQTARQEASEQRRALRLAGVRAPVTRPNTRDRRRLQALKKTQSELNQPDG